MTVTVFLTSVGLMLQFQISDSFATTEAKQLTPPSTNSCIKSKETACFSLHSNTESAGQAHSVESVSGNCQWRSIVQLKKKKYRKAKGKHTSLQHLV